MELEICFFLKTPALTTYGLSITAKPALTPPSLTWLAFVLISVPRFLLYGIPAKAPSLFFVSMKTHEYMPNSLKLFTSFVSPFLIMTAGIIGGLILSIIRYVLRASSSGKF